MIIKAPVRAGAFLVFKRKMNLPHYPTRRLSSQEFQFFSTGPKGIFELHVHFQQIGERIFNLAFGVWDQTTETVDDSYNLRNQDTDIILATVGRIALDFLDEYCPCDVFAVGSTPGRTRKYQMGISHHISNLTEKYRVLGFLASTEDVFDYLDSKESWREIEQGVNYKAFLITSK
ncbi:DUF6934 family protein [Dyadobacter sp. CY343]|uniref:DUF6934 family protein n=1 Tax=Dyadobacter sp. CY343 TaxID=2907299 RepID=UPI001F216B90|nr:hypothetical protein [Dyadobacter sp. CY343]MCE7063270.1 hypothetical protein [Dyadobacter sp. CY343]